MIGNAVPVEFGYALAHQIYQDLLDRNDLSIQFRPQNYLDEWGAVQLNLAI
jgi:hypothetical protein